MSGSRKYKHKIIQIKPFRHAFFSWQKVGMGQAEFWPSQVKSSFFENQNFKLKPFSNIWISSLIKPGFFNSKIFKPSQAQMSWVSSQVKSSIFNISIFKSNQVKLKPFDLICQVAWTFFSKNLIYIVLDWKNLYWNCKFTWELRLEVCKSRKFTICQW